jgi:hypothetical protein
MQKCKKKLRRQRVKATIPIVEIVKWIFIDAKTSVVSPTESQ